MFSTWSECSEMIDMDGDWFAKLQTFIRLSQSPKATLEEGDIVARRGKKQQLYEFLHSVNELFSSRFCEVKHLSIFVK